MGPFGCLSNDSEYLTPSGWKRMDEYVKGDMVAQYHPQDSNIDFLSPSDYIVLPCEYFYNFKGVHFDMMLSSDHKMLWRDIDGKLYTCLAHEAARSHWSKYLEDEIPNLFFVSDLSRIDLEESALRLTVAVIAEGSFHKHKEIVGETCNTCSMGFKKERKKLRIEKLLNESHIPFKKTEYENGKNYYYFKAPLKTKKFDKTFWQTSNDQRKIILDELKYWDFHSCFAAGNIFQYSTIEKEDADFIQYCLVTQGIVSNISIRDRKDGIRKVRYRINISLRSKKAALYQDFDSVTYIKSGNGFKYCFKTETGFFIARRNGKIFITGNSGKTSGCVMEIIRRAHEQVPSRDGIRRSRWAVIRNHYGQLKDTTIRTFHEWYPPKIFGSYHVTDHNYYITKFPGVQLEICYRALDREDHVSNLLSFEFTGAYFNEVREIPWGIIDAMDGRIGRYPKKDDVGEYWHGIIMDTNPPEEDSTLYKKAEIIRPDNFKMFKQPSGLSIHAENTKHLPKNYYSNLIKGKDDMFIRVYVHGQYGYVVSGKPVFVSFRDNIHVAPHPLEPMKGVNVLVGVDFGLSPSIILGQITPLGQLRILDELVSDGMGLLQFCKNQLFPLLRQKYFGMNIMGYGDPSGISRVPTDESTCFDILHSPEIGLTNIIPASTNAVIPRIGAVEFFLNKMYAGEPGFVLSPNCHFLRKAMNGAYHYDKDPKGNGEEYKPMPVKNFASHCADGLEYLCMYATENENLDRERKNFLAKLKQREYRPASYEVGY